MHATAVEDGTAHALIREVLDAVQADGRSALTAPEAKRV
jgi:hypothetical protein